MESLIDDTDHISYLTSDAYNNLNNNPFIKKVTNRKLSLPSILYYDESNDCWTFTSKKEKEEYIFNGIIDSLTGQPISGKCTNPTTSETYEGTFTSGLRSDQNGYGTNLQIFGGLHTKYIGKWTNNEPTDGIIVTQRYTYIGKLLRCRFHGRGWLAKNNMYIYDGEFVNGLYHGIGKFAIYDNCEKVEEYTGEFSQGIRQGIGTLRKKEYVYSGMWNCGLREGEGSEIIIMDKNEEEYVGQFLRDKRHGFGMMTRHGVVCEGTWRRGQPVDKSWVISYPDGRKYLGGLRHWMPHGKGIMIYSSSKGNELVIGAFDMGEYVKDNTIIRVDLNGVHCNNPQDAMLLASSPKSEDDAIIPHQSAPTQQKQNNVYLKTTDYYENGDIYHGQVDAYGRREGYGLYIHHTTGGTYEGTFSKNERHGSGILVIPNHLKFCGEFHHDYIHGYGTLVFEDSSSYNGHFINNKFHGKGTLCESNGSIYVGHFRHGLKHGDGMEQYSDGKVFLGEYKNGNMDGIGTLLEKENGKVLYSGKWREDLMDGYGVQVTAFSCLDDDSSKDSNEMTTINEQFEGHFICGQRSGEGTLTLSNGYVLEGTWLRDKPQTGVGNRWNITYPNGNQYIGDVILSPSDPTSIIPIPHGKGRLKYAHGDIYEGDFAFGKRHGKGLCIYVNWDTWRGSWENDSIDVHGGGELRLNNGTIKRFYNKKNVDDSVLEDSIKSLENVCLDKK